MNTIFNSISQHAVSIFREKILPALTSQQKKISILVSLAFGSLATCYLIRYFTRHLRVVKLDYSYEDVPEDIWNRQYQKDLSITDLSNLARVSKGCNNSVNDIFYEKARKIGYKGANDPHAVKAYLKAYQNSVLCLLARRQIVPKEKILDNLSEVKQLIGEKNSSSKLEQFIGSLSDDHNYSTEEVIEIIKDIIDSEAFIKERLTLISFLLFHISVSDVIDEGILYRSIAKKEEEIFEQLISLPGIDLNSRAHLENTPLESVVQRLPEEMALKFIDKLLKCKANPGKDDSLCYALSKSYFDVAKILFKSIPDINAKVYSGKTLLEKMVLFSTKEDILPLQWCIAHGASPKNDQSLSIAIDYAKDEHVINFLITHGANLSEPLLDLACLKGNSVAIECLLNHKLKLKIEHFFYAISSGSIEAAKRVLAGLKQQEEKIDFNAKSKKNQTMLDLAVESDKISMVKWILKEGAVPNGDLSILKALENGNLDIVDLLIEAGATIDFESEKSTSVLEKICLASKYNVLKWCVKKYRTQLPDLKGALKGEIEYQINIHHGKTLLEQAILPAILNGNSEMLEWLLQQGQDPKLISRMPLHLLTAIEHGHLAVANILLDAGISLPEFEDEFLEAICKNSDLAVFEWIGGKKIKLNLNRCIQYAQKADRQDLMQFLKEDKA